VPEGTFLTRIGEATDMEEASTVTFALPCTHTDMHMHMLVV
jgi:hypothetical protein